MKKITMPVCLAAFLAFGIGCNSSGSTDDANNDSVVTTEQSTTTTTITDGDTSITADREFMTEAASGGLMEVTAGKIASTTATSAAVKEVGQMMVTDHTKANTELKALAASKNIALPTAPNEKHQKHIDDLQAKKGAEFDKEYIDMMVKDHEEDISKFEDAANNGKDPDVKAFAAKTLPVLRKHLEHVKQVQDNLKK